MSSPVTSPMYTRREVRRWSGRGRGRRWRRSPSCWSAATTWKTTRWVDSKDPSFLRFLLARSWFLAIYNDDVYWYRQLSMVFPDLVCFMVRRWYHFKRFKPLECLSMPSAPGRRPARCAAPPSTSCPSIRYVRPSPLSLSLPFSFWCLCIFFLCVNVVKFVTIENGIDASCLDIVFGSSYW